MYHTLRISAAVIGAGVMGLAAARALGRRGVAVTLYDRAGFPAENASAMAGGMLAPFSEAEHLPVEYMAAAQGAIAGWKDLLQAAGAFTQNGTLLVAHKQDDYMLQRFAAKLPEGMRVRTDAAGLEPMLAGRFGAGIYLAGEAHLDPVRALAALGACVADRRAEDVSPQDLKGKHDLVVDCRGYGARGDEPELRGVKGEILTVRNAEFRLRRPVRLMHPRYPLYIVPRGESVFTIGATMTESADAAVGVKSALELLSALYSLHPSFGEAEILEIKAGVRPAYPDNLPRIMAAGDGIISCNGLFRHGYLLAPAMAECVAALAAGGEHDYMNLFCHSSLALRMTASGRN